MNKVYYGELYHYGVLGQKWGIRRYQNEDGSLTEAGKQRYRTDNVLNNVGRALSNTSAGQRLAVNLNKGYRQDKAEIKGLYKKKKAEAKTKEEKESLKSDYKKTLAEARTAAAEAIYPWQSKSVNQKIQTESIGRKFGKSLLLGGSFGSLMYDRLQDEGYYSKATSVGAAWVLGMADAVTAGWVSTGTYLGERALNEYKRNGRP